MKPMDGRSLALERRESLKKEVHLFSEKQGFPPCLAVILVGDNPASHVYVKNKIKACTSAGIKSLEYQLKKETPESELIERIHSLNRDSRIHAVLVQLPLPSPMNEAEILAHLNPLKDADGLCIENLGLLLSGRKRVAPCTPAGVIEILKKYNIPIEGQNAVVVGRSQIVGKPMALLLLRENATVTLCHSKTGDLNFHLKKADIVVVAAGKPEFLGAENFSKGSVIVDVGIHRKKEGGLCGDVRYNELEKVAKAATPVPGGVGPMTIAMLLENTLKLAKLQTEKKE